MPLQEASVGIHINGIAPTCFSAVYFAVFLSLVVYAILDELSPGILWLLWMDGAHGTSKTVKLTALNENARIAIKFGPVIIASTAWAALYNSFLQAQAASIFWVHQQLREKGNASSGNGSGHGGSAWGSLATRTNPAARRGLIFSLDRTVGNMLEQSVPFLMALWLNAAVNSPRSAAHLGWAWLALRACYPLAFHRKPLPGARFGVSSLSLITYPSYALICALLGGAVRAVIVASACEDRGPRGIACPS